MRFMYDALDWTAIPHGAQLVAGYVGWPGEWADSRHGDGFAYWRSQGVVVVTIASQPSIDAQVLDVERGDAVPAQAPSWVLRQRARGADPTVYMSEAVWNDVESAFAAAAVAPPHYWVAAYPGEGAVVPPGAVAHQYSSGAYDTSVVLDHWPGVDPAPPIAPKRGKRVWIFVLPNGSLYSSDLITFRWLNGDAIPTAQWLIAAAGGPAHPIPVARWQDMGVPADPGSAQAAGCHTYPASAA